MCTRRCATVHRVLAAASASPTVNAGCMLMRTLMHAQARTASRTAASRRRRTEGRSRTATLHAALAAAAGLAASHCADTALAHTPCILIHPSRAFLHCRATATACNASASPHPARSSAMTSSAQGIQPLLSSARACGSPPRSSGRGQGAASSSPDLFEAAARRPHRPAPPRRSPRRCCHCRPYPTAPSALGCTASLACRAARQGGELPLLFCSSAHCSPPRTRRTSSPQGAPTARAA